MARIPLPLETNRDSALMRATVVAWHWVRAAILGGCIGSGALILLITGHASAALALPSAVAGAALALIAVRRARAAFERIEETMLGEPLAATRNELQWAAKYAG